MIFAYRPPYRDALDERRGFCYEGAAAMSDLEPLSASGFIECQRIETSHRDIRLGIYRATYSIAMIGRYFLSSRAILNLVSNGLTYEDDSSSSLGAMKHRDYRYSENRHHDAFNQRHWRRDAVASSALRAAIIGILLDRFLPFTN